MYSISEEMVDEFLVRHNTAVFITTCDLVNSNFTYLNHRLKNWDVEQCKSLDKVKTHI